MHELADESVDHARPTSLLQLILSCCTLTLEDKGGWGNRGRGLASTAPQFASNRLQVRQQEGVIDDASSASSRVAARKAAHPQAPSLLMPALQVSCPQARAGGGV